MAPLAFPIRVDPQSGGFASVAPGSDEETNQEIALHVLVRPGEVPLYPNFGTPSLPFGDGLDTGGVQLQLREHGHPDVRITEAITDETPTPGAVSTRIHWERDN